MSRESPRTHGRKTRIVPRRASRPARFRRIRREHGREKFAGVTRALRCITTGSRGMTTACAVAVYVSFAGPVPRRGFCAAATRETGNRLRFPVRRYVFFVFIYLFMILFFSCTKQITRNP